MLNTDCMISDIDGEDDDDDDDDDVDGEEDDSEVGLSYLQKSGLEVTQLINYMCLMNGLPFLNSYHYKNKEQQDNDD